MDPEIIDWENVESEFEEDDEYENIDAPRWVDLSIPEELLDDEAWFCKSGCKHPKTAEDFLNSKSSKIKLLRSMTISDFRFFREKSRRGGLNVKQTEKSSASANHEFSKSKRLQNFQIDAENRNPNHSSQQQTRKEGGRRSTEKKKHTNGSSANPPARDQKPLKETFSARNLGKGREIMSQVMEFCSSLKKMANRSAKKGELIPAETKMPAAERRRRPLQAK